VALCGFAAVAKRFCITKSLHLIDHVGWEENMKGNLVQRNKLGHATNNAKRNDYVS